MGLFEESSYWQPNSKVEEKDILRDVPFLFVLNARMNGYRGSREKGGGLNGNQS